MPIVIKKKVIAKAPEPLVDPRPAEPVPAPEPKAVVANERTPFHKLPVASSAEELFANPGKMRAPDATVCNLCGHLYGFPCHGENPKCMNAVFARENGKKVVNA